MAQFKKGKRLALAIGKLGAGAAALLVGFALVSKMITGAPSDAAVQEAVNKAKANKAPTILPGSSTSALDKAKNAPLSEEERRIKEIETEVRRTLETKKKPPAYDGPK